LAQISSKIARRFSYNQKSEFDAEKQKSSQLGKFIILTIKKEITQKQEL
jgi:hypothetical protein